MTDFICQIERIKSTAFAPPMQLLAPRTCAKGQTNLMERLLLETVWHNNGNARKQTLVRSVV